MPNKIEKPRIRALILDYGGVISHPQNPADVNQILQILGQEEQDFKQVYERQRADYDRGELSGTEYWSNILKYFGQEISNSKIRALIQLDLDSWTHLNKPMLGYIEAARERVQKLAIISNMTHETLGFMSQNFKWLTLFHECVYSCEIGINKPDPRIYETCLSRLDLPPAECLFVDDTKKNVDGALQMGMHALHFTSQPQFQREVEANFDLSAAGE